MTKKIISIVLALLMIMTAAVADVVASPAVPSSVVPSATINSITGVDGSTLPEGFSLVISELAEEKSINLFEEVKEATATETISEYLGEEFVAAAAEYIPEGTDASAFVVDEFEQLTCNGYEEEMGDVVANFTFLTAYEEGTVLLGAVGIVGEETEWTPVKAEVAEDGNVNVTFTQDLLVKLEGAEAVFTLLRAE